MYSLCNSVHMVNVASSFTVKHTYALCVHIVISQGISDHTSFIFKNNSLVKKHLFLSLDRSPERFSVSVLAVYVAYFLFYSSLVFAFSRPFLSLYIVELFVSHLVVDLNVMQTHVLSFGASSE